MATGYPGWGWEQILGQVLGIGVPDRTQITGQTWLTIQRNAPAAPGMHQIWAATWHDPGNGGRQSITVYLNPALYTAGGAWDTFLNAPSAALSGVPAGNYGALPVNPPSFQSAQVAVASVASLLGAKPQQFGALSADLASGSSGFKGSGGEVVANLLYRLRGITDAIHSQMTSPVAYSDAIATAGDVAQQFLADTWAAYTAWTLAPPSSPLGVLVQVMQGVGADPKHTSCGDLTTDAAWAQVESAAKTRWLDTPTGPSGDFAGLHPLSKNALSMLENQYAATAYVLDPLPGPAPPSAHHAQAVGPQTPPGSPRGVGGRPGGPGGAPTVVSGIAGGVPGGPSGQRRHEKPASRRHGCSVPARIGTPG